MDKAEHRDLQGYVEKHHRIPKALGGGVGGNLIRLTAREHLIAHRLLTRMTSGPHKYKMISALWAMCNLKSGSTSGRIRASGRVYEVARIAYAEKMSATTRGLPKSPEHRRKIGVGNTGKIMSEASRLKLSVIRTGVALGPQSPAHKSKISSSMSGGRNPASRACFIGTTPYSTLTSAAAAVGLTRLTVHRHPDFRRAP